MTTGEEGNLRPLEAGITTDLTGLTYSSYLQLDTLLSAQVPLSDHHDELLFIVQHQTTELWVKLLVHELRAAMRSFAADDIGPALKSFARIKHVLAQMTDQWSVLATLTPTEYAQFRHVLGRASGFQSAQYRLLEFLLGNKNPAVLAVFRHDPAAQDELTAALEAPSVYDEFLRHLHRQGYAVPARVLDRDVTRPNELDPDLVEVIAGIYRDPATHWSAYETCEELVDIEDAFQLWRFRHLRTVERIIGGKTGTGGSSGVPFLRRALSLTFFPELFAVRASIPDR